MKVVYPKHIQKGMLAGMSFQIGPINLSIIQLFIVGIGVASAMGVFNAFTKSGAKAVGVILAIVIFLIAVFIAFFKMSELGLLAFIAKMIRNNFFDTNKKFQVNYEKEDHLKILIKESKSGDQTQTVFERKDKSFSKDKIDKIDTSGLI
ncbi:MAG: hypothetical protein WCO66_01815 [Candidatus Absconditabacteria bacterium]